MNTSPTIPTLSSLSSDYPRIKYVAAKQFIALSKSQPALLSPHLDFFINLMNSKNNILKWTAIDVVGNLLILENEITSRKLLKKLYGFLQEGKLITAAHAISALGTIAKEKPEYQKTITLQLLKTETYSYETKECWNIVMGKTLLALNQYSPALTKNKSVRSFAEHQTRNSRNTTKKKAEQLLKNITLMKTLSET